MSDRRVLHDQPVLGRHRNAVLRDEEARDGTNGRRAGPPSPPLPLLQHGEETEQTDRRQTVALRFHRYRRGRRRSSSTVTSRTSVQGGPTTGGGCYDELLTLVGYLARVVRRRAARLVGRLRRRARPAAEPPPPVYTVTGPPRRRRRPRSAGARRRRRPRRPGEAPYASPELSDIDISASPRRPQIVRPTATTTASAGAELFTTAPTEPRPPCPAGQFIDKPRFFHPWFQLQRLNTRLFTIVLLLVTLMV